MNTITQMVIGSGNVNSVVNLNVNNNETLLDIIAQQQQLISRLFDMQARWIAEIDRLTQKTIEP